MDAMSCLAPPPTSFFPAAPPAYYTDAAMARALQYSMSDHYSPAASTSSPSSSSSLLTDLPYSDGTNWFASTAPAPAPLTSLTCDSVLVASDAAPRPPSTPINTSVTPAATSNKRRLGLGVAAATGRAGKRRPRASKRAPTTYISTDPANFRLMVQHVTGIQAEPGTDDGTGVFTPTSFDASAAAALLDCPTYTGASFADALQLPSDADAATLHHRLQQQQQPCFPTLDSWNVLYESAQLF
ncbi:calmodulin-binding protein 25-like [Lolium rigidum]|uniref:calmodulin-binding protein 25-like n=1 Tax=Lolium rigidum TaxID=89674 RepID=UPI001F5D3DDE|nr:calmodulin-binding protein 25-like [Lolium rigidum]